MTAPRPPCQVAVLDRAGRCLHKRAHRMGATACGLVPAVCTVGPLAALMTHAQSWCTAPECFPNGLPSE